MDAEAIEILRFIEKKVIVFPHEIADHLWPDDPNRNLRIGIALRSLETDEYVVRRGYKRGCVVGTKKSELLIERIEAIEKAKETDLFGDGPIKE